MNDEISKVALLAIDDVITTTSSCTEVDVVGADTNTPRSMYERYMLAQSQIDTEPSVAITTLQQIQEYVAHQSYFSTSTSSSETLEDISTSTLPYLMIDYHLGRAYTQLPSIVESTGRTDISVRYHHLIHACDLFQSFLHILEVYDMLTNEETKQYQTLVEITDHIQQQQQQQQQNGVENNTSSSLSSSFVLPPPITTNRDTKIAQYRQKQQLQQEQERLNSLQLRRQRLHTTVTDDEILDGYDHESLVRTTHINSIHLNKMITYDEWNIILQELPMIGMMIQKQQQQQDPLQQEEDGADDRYQNRNHNSTKKKPMELTQITKDSTTGQLRIHRQDIQQQTFRPSWNQPTMSLEELAHREVHDAIQRQQQQTQSEAYQKTQPRRYEQLVKDGMEDDINLVDDSAIVDRQWDIFKDNNKRGSGNKRGDVGDRNF